METNELFAQKFKSARVKNGLSLQELAVRLDKKISRQALHKYEKGEVLPDSLMIGLLSDALNVRPEYFFNPTQVELGHIEFRKLKRLPAKEEKMIIEEARDYLSRYIELEEILGINSSFKNPIKNLSPIGSIADIENAASELRKEWKLGIEPLVNVYELLEDHHIKIVEIEAGDAYDGMQMIVNESIPVIAINKHTIKKNDRKRFTAMHELAHLLLSFQKNITEKQKETFCHQFAAAMLFPAEALIKELGKKRNRLFMQELGTLKQQYGISIQAIVMRCKDIGIITDYYCRQFFFFIKQMGWKVDEPVEYNGIESSKRFDQLLFRGLAEEMISMSKAASLKNQKLAEFRSQSLMVG